MFLAIFAEKQAMNSITLYSDLEGGGVTGAWQKTKAKSGEKKSALQIMIARIRPRTYLAVFKSIFFSF